MHYNNLFQENVMIKKLTVRNILETIKHVITFDWLF